MYQIVVTSCINMAALVVYKCWSGHAVLKILRRKKALSTVIAQVIMLSATMALGAIAINWAVPTLQLYQSNAGIYYEQRAKALKESFIIEDVWFNPSPNYVNITIRNVGSIEIQIAALYINGTSYSFTLDPSKRQVTTPEGQYPIRTYKIDITSTPHFTWVAGKKYLIVIATQRGNQVTSMWGT